MTENLFVERLDKSYRNDGFLTKREVGVGYGVADLVLFRPHVQNCLKRIEHKQSRRLLNEGYFRVFSSLPDFESTHTPMSLEALHSKTAYSPSFLKYKLLADLKRARYVKETADGYYFKINGWLPIGKEVIAIEAKLRDWKRGFYQANRYRVFADKAYLVVPMNIIPSVDQALLRKHGVGLVGFDAATGAKKIIAEARRTEKQANNVKRSLASEFFWGAKLRSNLNTI